jgi:sugar/nucleoside kinase (ribokinase family)
VVGEINRHRRRRPRAATLQQAERYVRSIRLAVGSSSVITACGATRLGLRTAFVGVVGDDLFGRFMLDEMRARGIDVSACRFDQELPTGVTVVLDTGADRAILTAPGAMASLHAEKSRTLMRKRHLVAVPPDAAPRPASRQHTRGLTTSLDGLGPAEEWQGLQTSALTDLPAQHGRTGDRRL